MRGKARKVECRRKKLGEAVIEIWKRRRYPYEQVEEMRIYILYVCCVCILVTTMIMMITIIKTEIPS